MFVMGEGFSRLLQAFSHGDVFALRRVRARTGIRNILCRSLKNTPYRVPVVAIVVIGRIDIRRIEVQVVHIGVIVTRRRPVVAVAALIRGRTIVEVASERTKTQKGTKRKTGFCRAIDFLKRVSNPASSTQRSQTLQRV